MRTLDQVMSELGGVYAPQEELLKQKQSLIPGQIANEEQALGAQEKDYFDNTIMSDARRRGIGFGGIPIGERARYGATQYLPALARLKQSGREQAMSLEEALLGINERKRSQGQSIFENERSFAEQQRQFNEQMAFSKAQAAAQAAAQARAAAAAKATLTPPTTPQQKPRQKLISTNSPHSTK